MQSYQQARNLRGDVRQYVQSFKGGILSPVNAMAFHESEGGLYDFRAVMELAPISGRMFTKVRARAQVVFVPLQGIYALAHPDEVHTGEAHVVREKLLSGDPLFPMEDDNEILQRCFVHPMPINGELKACSSTRLAHIAAVNHLRLRKYHKAKLLENTHMTQSPALLSQTVLDRFNAALDPDDRINGSVEFNVPNVNLPVDGIGVRSDTAWGVGAGTITPHVGTKDTAGYDEYGYAIKYAAHGDKAINIRASIDNPDSEWLPDIRARGELQTSSMSTLDFFKAEQRDKRTRYMEAMIKADPVHGERKALLWAHGLSMDTSKTPVVMYDEEVAFGYSLRTAMDGPNLDKEQTESNVVIDLSLEVPRTEFGGVMITFLSVIPDETLEYQPHPVMSQPWTGTKYTEEEMEYDPVKVEMRQLAVDVPQSEENNRAFYVGHNHMKLRYSSYGLARNLDADTVENKSALWQIKVPLSVTEDSIFYPPLEGEENYPFSDWNGDLCLAFISAGARIPTPMILGEAPVETVDIIDANDLFGQVPDDAE